MDNEEFIGKVAALTEHWNKAEIWVKKAENINDGRIVLPAIKKLRYVGRLLVDAFDAQHKNDNEKVIQKLTAVSENLTKVRHGVVDAIFTFYAVTTMNDIKSHTSGALTCASYPKLMPLINEMRGDIERARGERENQDKIYECLYNKIDDLRSLTEVFSVEVDSKLEQSKKEKLKNWGILGTIVTLILRYFS